MLSSMGERPKPLTTDELRKLVDDALALGAYTYREPMIESLHARFDHPERDLDVNDVLHGLKTGWKSSRPDEFHNFHWQWTYAIKTEDIESEPLTIIIAVDSRNRSFEVVTRW